MNLFSFKGRVTNKKYLVIFFTIFTIFAIFSFLSTSLSPKSSISTDVLVFLFNLHLIILYPFSSGDLFNFIYMPTLAKPFSMKPLEFMILGVHLILFYIIFVTSVKRYHDRGKSGLWFFINFIPFIGPLIFFSECGFAPGTVGPNKYGEDPRQV